ncbi:MAG: RNA methyltransferase [Actinomycetota bacterium]|nr:RNA methyltransferase [Actinomycetota bacterium]
MTIALTARVARGLEWVSADEIATRLPTGQMTLGRREVRFTLPELEPAVGALRTVDDVFVRAGALDGVGRDRRAPSMVGEGVRRLDLTGAVATVGAFRELPDRPAFDVVASLDGDRRFNRYDLEDALGATLGPMIRGRYGSHRDGPPPPSDLTFRVAVAGEVAEITVRLAVRPLHRRPWKHDTGPATLHPPAAAALLRLIGPRMTVCDPFCGDGTIPIEARLAANPVRAAGSDLDDRRVANARANASRAGVALSWAMADATRGPWRLGPDGAWVTHPPWNRAVHARGGATASLVPAWVEGLRLLGPTGTLAVLVEDGGEVDPELGPAGWRTLLNQRTRLAGRVCRLVIAVPIDGPDRDPLSPTLRSWRWRAADEGLVTESGF